MEGKNPIKFSVKEVLIICAVALVLSFVGVLAWYTETNAPTVGVSPTSSSTPPVGAEKANLIRIFSLKAGDTVKSPLHIEGEARGNWFFEATFPVELLDESGKTVFARTHAQAKGDWMTTNFVPFEATVDFAGAVRCIGCSVKALLVLKKDNPSGLPQNDDSISVPLVLVFGPAASSSAACRPAGCSGQICSDKEGVITTCEYRAEYACYKTARCERQPSGECGWTQTSELQACLKNPPPLN